MKLRGGECRPSNGRRYECRESGSSRKKWWLKGGELGGNREHQGSKATKYRGVGGQGCRGNEGPADVHEEEDECLERRQKFRGRGKKGERTLLAVVAAIVLI